MSNEDKNSGTFTIAENSFDVNTSGQNVVTFTDKGGHTLKYQRFKGILYVPLFNLKYLKQIRSFKMREDDVYLSGYPRTGTHWTNEMTSMLLSGRAETIQSYKHQLELISAESLETIPSPRVINSHIELSRSPDDIKLKKVKVIYTLRDPKDAAVSLYKLYYGRVLFGGVYKGTFEDFLQLTLDGKVEHNGMFEHLRDAEKFFLDNPDISVHLQRYEDTILDPVKSVQKLSDFLGLRRNNDLCRSVAEKCELSRMKVDKDKFAMKIDGESCLFRKGIIGDWRNYFTDEMLEEYYRVYEDKMSGSKFYDIYSKDTI